MSILRPQKMIRCMYSTRILDGWRISEKLTEKTALRLRHIKEETGVTPGLAVIRFGYNADTERFMDKKKNLALRCGVNLRDFKFDASTKTEEVLEKIRQLNKDRTIHGIVIKTPLPSTVNEDAVLEAIAPIKDVDGCCHTNQGRLLKLGGCRRRASEKGLEDDIHYYNMVNLPSPALATLCFVESYKLPLEKKKATIIGRSDSVGLPIALLLTHKDMTCQVTPSHTELNETLLKDSDYVISTQGTAQKVKGDWLKPQCTVIDIGHTYASTATEDEVEGSVDVSDCCNVASNITPVPGGTGMLSSIMLMQNTMKSMVLQEGMMPLYERMGGRMNFYESLLS